MYKKHIAIYLFILLIFPAPFWGDSSEDIRLKFQLLREEAQSLKKEKKFTAAIGKYKEMRSFLQTNFNVFPNRQDYERHRSNALLQLGYCYLQKGKESSSGQRGMDLRRAEKNLEDTLRFASSQENAWYYLGEVHFYQSLDQEGKSARKKRKMAKKYFKIARKRGFPVFSHLSSDSQMKTLLSDALFLLELANSQKKYDFSDFAQSGNPFQPKVKLKKKSERSKSDLSKKSAKKQKELLEEIKSTYRELEKAVNKSSPGSQVPGDKVIKLWNKLVKLIKRKDEILIPRLQNQLLEVFKDIAENQDRLEKIQLASYFNKGRDLLKSMRNAFVFRKYEKVMDLWKELRGLARDMARSGNENFRKTAQALLNNGETFAKQAKTYLDLKSMTIDLQGIYYRKFPGKRKIAIVNGRLHRVGDLVRDKDDRKLKFDVKVKKIYRNKVIFLFRRIELTKYLKENKK